MYSIHIYLSIYSLIFGKMYDKETFFLAEIYLFSFYMQIDFIYSVCLKKIMTPPAWSTTNAVTPLYQFPIFFMAPHYLFATPPPPPPLEINNDRSLSDPRKIGLSIFNYNFSHCGFYVLGNNHLLIWGGGGGLRFSWKKYFNALADRKTI